MPIHELGYRAWQGRLVAPALRFWAITETGIRLAWQTQWLRRLVFFAWLPAAYLTVGFLFYEQWLTQSGAQARARETLLDFLPNMPLQADRHYVWSWLLWVFFRYPQGIVLVLVVGLIAPPLVAQDVRTRAFLLYFSRPITRLEYLVGKMAVVWAYLLGITTLPALALYLVAVTLSPELSVVGTTWDLPLRIVGASAILIIPTTALALALSSLTSETRYASFAWFTVWVIGWVTYAIVYGNLGSQASEYWTLVSLYHTLGQVEGWVFGLPGSAKLLMASAVQLAGLTAVSLGVLFHRISSPMRI